MALGRNLNYVKEKCVNLYLSPCLKNNRNINHVVAARKTAEDSNLIPHIGNVAVSFIPSKNTLIYFSVLIGTITESNDCQFGHVFSYACTREDAIINLINALKKIKVTGVEIPVNRIISILKSKTFRNNKFNTTALEKEKYFNICK